MPSDRKKMGRVSSQMQRTMLSSRPSLCNRLQNERNFPAFREAPNRVACPFLKNRHLWENQAASDHQRSFLRREFRGSQLDTVFTRCLSNYLL